MRGISRIKVVIDIQNFGQRHRIVLHLRGRERILPA